MFEQLKVVDRKMEDQLAQMWRDLDRSDATSVTQLPRGFCTSSSSSTTNPGGSFKSTIDDLAKKIADAAVEKIDVPDLYHPVADAAPVEEAVVPPGPKKRPFLEMKAVSAEASEEEGTIDARLFLGRTTKSRRSNGGSCSSSAASSSAAAAPGSTTCITTSSLGGTVAPSEKETASSSSSPPSPADHDKQTVKNEKLQEQSDELPYLVLDSSPLQLQGEAVELLQYPPPQQKEGDAFAARNKARAVQLDTLVKNYADQFLPVPQAQFISPTISPPSTTSDENGSTRTTPRASTVGNYQDENTSAFSGLTKKKIVQAVLDGFDRMFWKNEKETLRTLTLSRIPETDKQLARAQEDLRNLKIEQMRAERKMKKRLALNSCKRRFVDTVIGGSSGGTAPASRESFAVEGRRGGAPSSSGVQRNPGSCDEPNPEQSRSGPPQNNKRKRFSTWSSLPDITILELQKMGAVFSGLLPNAELLPAQVGPRQVLGVPPAPARRYSTPKLHEEGGTGTSTSSGAVFYSSRIDAQERLLVQLEAKKKSIETEKRRIEEGLKLLNPLGARVCQVYLQPGRFWKMCEKSVDREGVLEPCRDFVTTCLELGFWKDFEWNDAEVDEKQQQGAADKKVEQRKVQAQDGSEVDEGAGEEEPARKKRRTFDEINDAGAGSSSESSSTSSIVGQVLEQEHDDEAAAAIKDVELHKNPVLQPMDTTMTDEEDSGAIKKTASNYTAPNLIFGPSGRVQTGKAPGKAEPEDPPFSASATTAGGGNATGKRNPVKQNARKHLWETIFLRTLKLRIRLLKDFAETDAVSLVNWQDVAENHSGKFPDADERRHAQQVLERLSSSSSVAGAATSTEHAAAERSGPKEDTTGALEGDKLMMQTEHEQTVPTPVEKDAVDLASPSASDPQADICRSLLPKGPGTTLPDLLVFARKKYRERPQPATTGSVHFPSTGASSTTEPTIYHVASPAAVVDPAPSLSKNNWQTEKRNRGTNELDALERLLEDFSCEKDAERPSFAGLRNRADDYFLGNTHLLQDPDAEAAGENLSKEWKSYQMHIPHERITYSIGLSGAGDLPWWYRREDSFAAVTPDEEEKRQKAEQEKRSKLEQESGEKFVADYEFEPREFPNKFGGGPVEKMEAIPEATSGIFRAVGSLLRRPLWFDKRSGSKEENGKTVVKQLEVR
ncbi:unnamed protein product [Amoebophrya sp. A120]|nr:unnamed protein product [Amoebophrya sp. A120]|eukprot:GSA120T00008382001.1